MVPLLGELVAEAQGHQSVHGIAKGKGEASDNTKDERVCCYYGSTVAWRECMDDVAGTAPNRKNAPQNRGVVIAAKPLRGPEDSISASPPTIQWLHNKHWEEARSEVLQQTVDSNRGGQHVCARIR